MARFDAPVLALVAAATALSTSGVASAQLLNATSDQGTSATDEKGAPTPAPVRWHGSLFVWDHAVTTQTIGLGGDYQSRNPTYEMTLRLAPRFYLLDNKQNSVSARADVRLVREFTNSDTTTERGEWTFLDTELWLTETQTLDASRARHSELVFRAPMLVLPTSKSSYSSGRLLGLGLGVGLDHRVPLRGEGKKVLPSLLLRPRANYTYQFAQAVVGTNDAIDRYRLDADGRTVRSDQLSGSALPQHQAVASLRVDIGILSELEVVTEFGMRYARRYALADSTLVTGPDTGPVQVDSRADASRWSVSTLFAASLAYVPLDYLEVSVGYINQSLQLGADGRRRSFFYSPDAQAFLALTVALDALYQTARGREAGESSHTASAPFKPAL
jgi:hypothetical protein